MAAATRLAAFGVILAGSFGTAYAVGERLPGHVHSGSTDGHSQTHGPAMVTPPSTSDRGYQLVAKAAGPGGTAVAFRIQGRDGQTITAFTEAHGALLHTVLIHPDLSGFQHVHPTIAADGTFVVDPGAPGPWRVILETQPASTDSPVVLATDIDDETPPTDTPLPTASSSTVLEVQGDTITVERSGTNFIIDAPAPLEPYLGQQAHLIAIRQGDLAYTHIHPGDPMTGMLMFSRAITEPGTYRLFLQFGYRSEVVTAAFTVVVP